MLHGVNGFTFLPKEGMLRIFLPEKIPTVSTGSEPVILGTRGQHANHQTTEAAEFKSYFEIIFSRMKRPVFKTDHLNNLGQVK
jgi:hypothetical protein